MTNDFTFVQWCSGCHAEQAVDEIEVQVADQWVTLNIGRECLTRLAAEGKIEM